MNTTDIIGRRFGRLMVVEFADVDHHGKALWRCACDCGAVVVKRRSALIVGSVKSCGCLPRDRMREMNTTHAHYGDPTHGSWKMMIRRCYDENFHKHPDYGGRGITVCERWRGPGGFANFLADVGPRPVGKTIDRFPDPDGNYEPGNVRWATALEQRHNRRAS